LHALEAREAWVVDRARRVDGATGGDRVLMIPCESRARTEATCASVRPWATEASGASPSAP
jgi:hypothetical protein